MNLAHVEHYFADFLSVLESGRLKNGLTTEKVRLHSEIEDARRRERRALSLVHMHETMLTSLRAAYTDVMVNRWAAEARATTMLEDAARRVRLGDLGDVRR